MKVLGLIEQDLDIVSKEYVDEKFSNHQTHLEELDKKIGSNNTELGSYLKKDVVTFVNSFGKKCMGVFKVIDGSPVIELVEVGE